MRHTLDEPAVRAAMEEVVMRDHLIASGDGKRLYFNPSTSVYRIKAPGYEATCKTAAEASRLYSDH